MTDEQPPRRVVKRVVKKSVVRPPSAPEATPPVRYGRPVPTTGRPRPKVATPAGRPQPKVATPADRSTTAPPEPVKTPRRRPSRERPRLDVRATAGATGQRIGEAWGSVADRLHGTAGTAGGFVTARARTVAGWRLPHVNPFLGAVVSGVVAGIVAVALSLLALSVFSDIRGVASGGGLWGGLTFIAVALVAVGLGDLLLRGFGVAAARLTSFLGVVLTIVVMLGMFLDVVETRAALYLVPLLGAAAFAAAHWLVDLAESTPTVAE